MNFKLLFVTSIILFLSSCIVQSPKYTTLDKVISLQLGMTKAQVEDSLGVKPYDIKGYNDTSKTYVYVYRVIDRQTISFNTKPVNGRETIGRYVQVDISYSKEGKVIRIESCRLCPDNLSNTNKIDFGKIMIFFTVTMPVILIYLGLKK